MELIIRGIRPEDKKTFLAMSREFYRSPAVLHDVPESFHEEAFSELMRSDRYLDCRFYEDGSGEVIGYALLIKTFSREAGGVTIWVDELYVRPSWQGKGIAHRFFAWLEENIPAARYRLETEPENERARALYNRLGYTELPYLQMLKERKTTVPSKES